MKKQIALTVSAIGVLGLLGVGSASAHGWGWFTNSDLENLTEKQQQSLEEKAEILGTTPEELKEAFSEGKNLPEIIEDLDLNKDTLEQKIKERRENHMQERLEALIDKGVITQEQANEKMEALDEKLEKFNLGGKMGRGMMMRNKNLGDCPMNDSEEDSGDEDSEEDDTENGDNEEENNEDEVDEESEE